MLAQRPEVGECWLGPDLTPISCDADHDGETVFVTDYTGDADAPSLREIKLEADIDCRAAVGDYVGSDDWEVTRLLVFTLAATPDQYDGGARWARCDLRQSPTTHSIMPIVTTGSYAGALADRTELAELRRCIVDDGTKFSTHYFVSCSEPHNFEAVDPVVNLSVLGLEPSEEIMTEVMRRECPDLIDAYIGADRDDLNAVWLPPIDWAKGDRSGVCYVGTTDAVTGSLELIGNADLPLAG